MNYLYNIYGYCVFSHKTSTSALINAKGDFEDFGFDAEKMHAQDIVTREGKKPVSTFQDDFAPE